MSDIDEGLESLYQGYSNYLTELGIPVGVDDLSETIPAEPSTPAERATKGKKRKTSGTTDDGATAKSAPSQPKRSRAYCFTLFPDVERFYEFWRSQQSVPSGCRYLVFQMEICPSSGRLHAQGYVEVTKPMSVGNVIELLSLHGAHLEPRRGSADEAAKYCSKDDTRAPGFSVVELGVRSQQGRRSDLAGAVEMIAEGGQSAIVTIAQTNPVLYVRNFRGLQALTTVLHPPKPRPKPTVLWLHGPSGIGKSRLAHLLHPEAYVADDTSEGWFDGYQGETVVIFDEFVGAFRLADMLRIVDYHKRRQRIKFGFVSLSCHTFVFTSNFLPGELYRQQPQYRAWLRRIEEFAEVWSSDRIKLELTQRGL